MRFSEQIGYKLYDKNGIEINCPKTNVQGLITIAQSISGKTLYTKILSENECLLFESLSDVAKKKPSREDALFYIYGAHKSCCG